MTASPEGKTPIPDASENNPPLLLYKPLLGKYARSKHLAAFSVIDNSMEPTLPHNGIAIIDTADRLRSDGKLFAVVQNFGADKYMIKRLRYDGNELYLISDNNTYMPKLLKQAWEQVAIGRVVWSLLPQE